MTRILTALVLLSALVANGANLLPNSSFESGGFNRKGWLFYADTSVSGDRESGASTGEKFAPLSSNMWTNDAMTGSNAFRMGQAGTLWSQATPLTGGQAYKVSVWVKARANHSNIRWGVANATNYSTTPLSNTISATTSWARSSFNYTPAVDGLFALGFTWFNDKTNSWFTAFDDVMIEASASLNAWEPLAQVEAGFYVTNYSGIFFDDDPKEMGLMFYNASAQLDVAYEVRWMDDYNRCVQTNAGTHTATAGRSVLPLALPPTNGWLRVTSRLNFENSWDETAVFVVPQTRGYAQTVGEDSVIGTHPPASIYSANKYKDLFPLGRNLSPARQQMRWVDIQLATNTWVWYNDQVASWATNGVQVLAELTPGQDGEWHPLFAVTNGGVAYVSEASYITYCTNVAARYGSSGSNWIWKYEILNEPHQYGTRTANTNLAVTNKYAYPSNYARLYTSVVNAVTNVDPAARFVCIAGVGGLGSGGAQWAADVWALVPTTVRDRTDVLSYHLYPDTAIDPNVDDRSDDHFGWYREWRDTVLPLGKEMWNTEGGIWNSGGMLGRNALWPSEYQPTPGSFPGKYRLYAGALSPEMLRGWQETRTRPTIDVASRSIARNIGWGFTKWFYYDGRHFNGNSHLSTEPHLEAWDDMMRPHAAALASFAAIIDHGTGSGPLTNANSGGPEMYPFVGLDGRRVIGAWSPDAVLRTLTTTNGEFSQMDHWGNVLASNSTSVLLTRTPRFFRSDTLTITQLTNTFRHSTVATNADTVAPAVSVDIAPTGPYASGQFALLKWSAVDNQLVPYDAGNEATNIVYRYRVDGGSWSGYSQSNHVWLGVSEGNHTVTVAALDANGNGSELEYPFTLASHTNRTPDIIAGTLMIGP